MNQEVNSRLNIWINRLPRVAGVTAIVVGSIVLIGWMLDVPVLKSLHPALVSMKANTALTFVFAGTALLLLAAARAGKQRIAARFLACLVCLVGFLTVLEFAFGWDAGIDQLLFNEPQGTIGTYLPGRMALNTAISFCLLGLALSTSRVRTGWGKAFSQIAALVVGMFGLLVLLAYVYGLPGFTGFAVYTRMALHTAASFVLLSIAVICLQPDVGLIAVLTGEGSGGYMARRLMLAAVGVPIILGWLVVAGEMRGLYGNQFGDVIAATAYVAIFLFLIWTIGGSLNKRDSERTFLEQRIVQSEKEFRGLFDGAPVGYHEFDNEGRLTRVNQTELGMLGYQAGEMLGHFVWEFLDNQEASRQSVLAKLAGTKPPSMVLERLYRLKDLTTLPVVSEDKLLRDSDGHITGIRTTIQEITELKRAQKAVIASELELRRVWEGSFDGMRLVDGQGTILMVNDAYCTMIGKRREELVGKPLSIITVESGQQSMLEKHKQRFASGTIQPRTEKEVELWDGRRLWFEVSNSYIEIEGESRRALGIFRDITERKKVEREIRLLAHTISSATDCVSVTDLEDRVIFVNDAFVKTYGYAREELLGLPISIVRSPQTPSEIGSQILAGTMAGGWYGEIFNRRKDGSDFPIELWTSIVKDDDGNAIATVGVARDITERKVAEEERESLIEELKTALENVRTLDGLVPICAHCKKIRDDKGYWNQLERYIMDHTDAKLTHGLCPDCAEFCFPGITAKSS